MLKSLVGCERAPTFLFYGELDDNRDYIVMDLLGDDMSYIRNRFKTKEKFNVPVSVAVFLTQQIIECLKLFHDYGYVHRDVKPANFIRSSTLNTNFSVVDFGISKKVHYYSLTIYTYPNYTHSYIYIYVYSIRTLQQV